MAIFASHYFITIVTAGYVGAMLCLCFLLLLVSNFYRKKFDNPSPRFGFYLGLAAGLMFLGMLLSGSHPSPTQQLLHSVCLIICAGGSALGTIQLYLTMKQVKK